MTCPGSPSSLLREDDVVLLTLGEQQQEQLARILEDYLSDREAGRAVDREALVEAHPELAEALGKYLTSVETLYRAGVAVGVDPSADETGSMSLLAATSGNALSQSSQVGDYVIKHEIGRGGMGIVYAAQQISLGREVALKTLPFAAVMDQKQVARFKNEAQAAAGLHHPNIVPVYGVGCERGVHYFSMQLIEGQSLEQAIKQLRHGGELKEASSPSRSTAVEFSTQKSIRSRQFATSVARLGQQAAAAIHHAHESGVIHRDIKPSNLLLDAGGKLWITDFGLARMANANNLTVSGDMIGTARYMSPEQAAGRMHEVDHRSDIYSLGITLYELLTLHPAFDADTRQELLRVVQQETPVAPRRLNPSIPVDLETIVLKAIEKDRDNRYASAGELAEDLGHFLDGRPTLAKRPGLREHAFRWAIRHRTVVTTATVIVLLAMITLSGAAWMIRGEQRRTKMAADRATFRLRETQRVVDNFGALVDQRLEHLPGSSPLRAELLGELEKYYSAFLDEARDEPTLAVDLATTQFRLAAVHQRLGEIETARMGYRKALRGFEQLLRRSPHDLDRLADIALCHNNLGQIAVKQHDPAQGRREYRQAIADYQRLVAAGHREGRRGLARSQMNLGLLLSTQPDEDATEVLSQAYESLQWLEQQSREDPGIMAQLALCENNLASVVMSDDPGRAEDLLRSAVRRYRRLVQQQPASPDYRSDQALALGNLAAVIAHRGDFQGATELSGDVVSLRQSLCDLEPRIPARRHDLALAHQQLGQFRVSLGQFEQAVESLQQASEILLQCVTEDPRDDAMQSSLGRTLGNLAMAHARLGRRDRAVQLLTQAAAHQQSAIDLSPSQATYRDLLTHHRQQISRLAAPSASGIKTLNRTAGK